MDDPISKIVSANAPTTTNEKGGSQSEVKVRFDLIDSQSIFAMAQVLHYGAEKYGANNWRMIDVEDHLNHLIMHAYAYLSHDHSDDHLSHIMCRAMFAQGVAIERSKSTSITSKVLEENHVPIKNIMSCNRFHPGEICVPGVNHPAAK